MALEDLMRYESAAVAAVNAKKDPSLAVTAMSDFYRGALEEDDPIINQALTEAMVGGENGISNAGVIQAIGVYGGKYEKAFATIKFSDLVKYLTGGYSISSEVKKGLSAYNESTYLGLAKRLEDKNISDKDKKDIGRAVQAMNLLKDRKLRVETLGIVNGNTTAMLNQLYPKSEEKKTA